MYIVGLRHEKFHLKGQKINETSKRLVEGLVDFKIYALTVLGYIGSISAPDEATLKEESHALHCTTAGPYNAIPTDLRAGSVWGVGSDICGFISSVWPTVSERPPVLVRSSMALRKFVCSHTRIGGKVPENVDGI